MPATKPTGNPVKGVIYVAVAVLLFALADVLTKRLATAYGVIVVVALRYLVNLGLLAALLGPTQGSGLWRTNRTLLVILRGLCLAAASLTMGLALKVMPVAETVAIIYLAPIAVMFLAWRLLDEEVNLVGWLGAVAGFIGVLLIVRPGNGLDPVGVALALVNAGLAATYTLLTRVLGKTETMTSMLFHTALAGMVVFWALLPFQSLPAMPGLLDIILMGLLGALATAGHFLFTAAYREAPATTLAPVNYLHLVWAAVLGWLVFGHVPDSITILGMTLVVAAGVAVAWRTKLAHDAKKRTA